MGRTNKANPDPATKWLPVFANTASEVHRMPVPGGWLYRTRSLGLLDGYGTRPVVREQVTFVPE